MIYKNWPTQNNSSMYPKKKGRKHDLKSHVRALVTEYECEMCSQHDGQAAKMNVIYLHPWKVVFSASHPLDQPSMEFFSPLTSLLLFPSSFLSTGICGSWVQAQGGPRSVEKFTSVLLPRGWNIRVTITKDWKVPVRSKRAKPPVPPLLHLLHTFTSA